MRILIFEDELLIAKNLKELLLFSKLVDEVDIVNTLKMLETQVAKQSYNLALLDVNINGEPHGISAGLYLRKNFRMGIIYLSAYSDEKVIDSMTPVMPDGYLIKPIDEVHLLAVVKQVLYKYQNNLTSGNISEWRKKESLSLSRLEYFQDTIDRLYIISITNQKGQIVYTNDAFSKISGYKPEELLGHNHRIVNSGFHDKDFFAILWNTIKKGEIWQGEICNRHKSGALYWVSCNIFSMTSEEEGSSKHYVSIRTDITSKKETELALKKILADKMDELSDNRMHLSRVSKDESLVGFNSILLHELKRPTAALSMQLEYLLDKYGSKLPSEILESLNSARANTSHTVRLMSYLNQTFKRKHKANKEKISLLNQIESLLDFVKILFPYKDISFSLLPPEVTPDINIFVLGYSDALFIAVFNLLKNACEAFTEEQTDKRVWVQIVLIGTKVEIQICDNKKGGIPKNIASKLFSPLTSNKAEGSGLGLSISRHVIESMDAQIELTYSDDNGSCFKIKNIKLAKPVDKI